ncbi:O-antigen ligase family protein [Caenimonas terrae]|uniref:O-antigen ligase family protein n=1 Tax=Caenimonas terrae TaxID=696074 RepID=A0ABW0NIE4_9BURK
MYLTAAMLPFSLAAANIAKVLMLLFVLYALARPALRREALQGLQRLRTPFWIGAMLVLLALSLAYTPAPLPEALRDLNKYSKLLLIPMPLMLLRSRREAVIALGSYVAVECFVLLSSYLLSAGLHLPWVVKPLEVRLYVATVFSSYLDQSIMTVGLASLAWYLRAEFPGRHGPKLALGLVLLAVVNVLLLLPGRSAQVALVVALTMALGWAVPGRRRSLALLAPLLLVAGVMAGSAHFRDRTSAVITESLAYADGDPVPTSSGTRLNLWHRALQAIAEKPLIGHGIGSWRYVYARLERNGNAPMYATAHNPHQEYLLWGVHLGLGGIVLLLAFGYALVRDAAPLRTEIRRAIYSLVTILAVVSLFNSTLYDALIGDYFCLLLGVLLALGRMTPAAEPAA